MKIKNIVIAVSAILLLANCGTQKSVIKPSGAIGTTSSGSSTSLKQQQIQFMQRVSDGALYQKKSCFPTSLLTVNTGNKEISVPGILHMRKDEVIRLQLLIPIIVAKLDA